MFNRNVQSLHLNNSKSTLHQFQKYCIFQFTYPKKKNQKHHLNFKILTGHLTE